MSTDIRGSGLLHAIASTLGITDFNIDSLLIVDLSRPRTYFHSCVVDEIEID